MLNPTLPPRPRASRFAPLLFTGFTAFFALAPRAAAQSSDADPPGSRSVGEHFSVQLDWEAPELAEQALEAVEALWPAATELYGLKDWEREVPLEVFLYGTDEAYARADQELTGGNFAQNGAFAHFATRTAHVRLAPRVHPEVLARFGLPAMTRRLLAHEAAHLVRYETYDNHASHPDWFVHGAASLLDQAAMEALGRSDPEDPWEQKRWTRIQELLAGGRLPDLKSVLSGEGLANLSFYERYSVCEAAFAHVAGHRRAPKLWVELRRLGGGVDFAGQVVDQIENVLGKSYFKQAEKAWRKDLAKLEPAWEEALRHLAPLPEKEFGEGAWLQLAFPETNAIAFRAERTERLPRSLSGSLEVLPGRGQQANLIVAENAAGFTNLAWNPGQGLTLFRFTRAENRWERLGFVEARDLPAGRAVEFEVRLDDEGLEVSWTASAAAGGDDELAGRAAFAVAREDWLTGRWGLGAQAGSAVLWRGLDVRGR